MSYRQQIGLGTAATRGAVVGDCGTFTGWAATNPWMAGLRPDDDRLYCLISPGPSAMAFNVWNHGVNTGPINIAIPVSEQGLFRAMPQGQSRVTDIVPPPPEARLVPVSPPPPVAVYRPSATDGLRRAAPLLAIGAAAGAIVGSIGAAQSSQGRALAAGAATGAGMVGAVLWFFRGMPG